MIMIIYEDDGQTKAVYRYVDDVDEILSQSRFRNSTNIIGGTDYIKSSWSTKAYYAPISRTVIAYKDNKAYLITVLNSTIPLLKPVLEELDLDSVDSVILDGSGSTCMQVKVDERRKNITEETDIYIT